MGEWVNEDAVGLQLNGAARPEGFGSVPEILHGGMFHDGFAVQRDGGAISHHANPEMIPFTERIIRQEGWILACRPGAVVPEATGPFIGADVPFASLFRVIPDLHLRIGSKVNTAVRLGDGFVVQ